MRKNAISLLALVCVLLFWGCSQKVTEPEAPSAPEEQLETVAKASNTAPQARIDALAQATELTDAQRDQINAIYAEYADQLNTLEGKDLRDVRRKINTYIRTEVLTPEQVEQVRNQQGGGG